MKRIIPCLALLTLLSFYEAKGQGSDIYGSGLKVKINEDGSKYFRMIFWNQVWVRYNQNNPGTLVGGESQNYTFDIGARRLRALVYAQITPRYLILAHWGINNQTFINGGGSGTVGSGGYGQGKKPQMFFHDVWNEYTLVPAQNADKKENPFSMAIGGGLHYWWGYSRMTSASTLNFLMVDAPVFNWPLIEMSDQFARQYGIYTKGFVGKLSYRAHLNKPFATNVLPTAIDRAVDNNRSSRLSTGAYLDYQFFEKESDLLPFRVGTYVGTKKVFNVGAGFYQQKQATLSINNSGDTVRHDMFLASVDVFLDMPIGNKEKKQAITLYSCLSYNDFGTGYIRSTGIMNVGTNDAGYTGTRAQEGAGNSRYLTGTGTVWYTQMGYLLPAFRKNKTRLQPIASYTLKDMKALREPGHYYDIGCNVFLDGHHSKLTVQYSNRALYSGNTNFTRRGEWILQMQVYL